MAKKYADVDVKLTVSFEDDGETCLKDQAHEAAAEALGIMAFSFVKEVAFVEVVGEVRDTETPK